MDKPEILPRHAEEMPTEFAESEAYFAEIRRQVYEDPEVAIRTFARLIESRHADDRHTAACGIHLSLVADRGLGLGMWGKLLGDSDWSVRGTA